MFRTPGRLRETVLAAACCALMGAAAADTPPASGGTMAPPGMPAAPMPPPGSAGGPPPGGPGGPPAGMPGPPPALPDNPAAAAHRALAKEAAGTRWQNEYEFLCPTGTARPARMAEDAIEPQWLFDNVAVIGDRGTVMFVLKTSAGIMLIDSGYSTKLESVLLPSLQKLGIDPASVKTIVISHGHADHFGGAPYFQKHYGTHIVASAADWDLIDGPPPAFLPPNPQPWMLAKGPTRDIVVGDGGQIVLGDLQVKAFLIPGHTPGSLGFIFPVKDAGRTHMAAIFGGTILDYRLIKNDGLHQYVESLAHFGEAAHKNKVDVELQNHPWFDDMWVKAGALSARKSGEANPFVVGDADYQHFLTVMSQCTQATLAQRP